MYLHCCRSGAGNPCSFPPPGTDRQIDRCTYIAVDLVQVVPAVSLLQVGVEYELHAARRLVEVKFVLVRLEVEESIFSESELRFYVSVSISF